jgi:hypothetical protein
VHAPAFYYELANFACHQPHNTAECKNVPGVDTALNEFAGLALNTFNKTGFNILVCARG